MLESKPVPEDVPQLRAYTSKSGCRSTFVQLKDQQIANDRATLPALPCHFTSHDLLTSAKGKHDLDLDIFRLSFQIYI